MTVKGWNNGQLTERDYDTETSTADRRSAEVSRFRKHMTVTDGAAVLYRCGCVATVKPSTEAAHAWLEQIRPDDPDRWDGATVVPASTGFDGPVLTVWAPDGTVMPYARGRCTTQTGGQRDCAAGMGRLD